MGYSDNEEHTDNEELTLLTTGRNDNWQLLASATTAHLSKQEKMVKRQLSGSEDIMSYKDVIRGACRATSPISYRFCIRVRKYRIKEHHTCSPNWAGIANVLTTALGSGSAPVPRSDWVVPGTKSGSELAIGSRSPIFINDVRLSASFKVLIINWKW